MSEQCTANANSGNRCRLRTLHLSESTGNCDSKPICWIHLRKNHQIRIMNSTLPGAGKGLFLEKHVPANALIGQYTGKREAVNAPNTPYTMALDRWHKVNASDPLKSSVMRYINHKGHSTANAKIVGGAALQNSAGQVACRAIRTKTRNIAAIDHDFK